MSVARSVGMPTFGLHIHRRQTGLDETVADERVEHPATASVGSVLQVLAGVLLPEVDPELGLPLQIRHVPARGPDLPRSSHFDEQR